MVLRSLTMLSFKLEGKHWSVRSLYEVWVALWGWDGWKMELLPSWRWRYLHFTNQVRGWWRQDLSMAVMFWGEWRSHLWCIGGLTAVVGENLLLREMIFAVVFWTDVWVSIAFWKAKEKAVAGPAIGCIPALLWGQRECKKPIAQQSWTEKSDKLISSPAIYIHTYICVCILLYYIYTHTYVCVYIYVYIKI